MSISLFPLIMPQHVRGTSDFESRWLVGQVTVEITPQLTWTGNHVWCDLGVYDVRMSRQSRFGDFAKRCFRIQKCSLFRSSTSWIISSASLHSTGGIAKDEKLIFLFRWYPKNKQMLILL